MSDDRGSNWVGPFVLGFLLGVLLCVGGGGAVLMSWQRQRAMMEREAMYEAERAREAAVRAEMELREAQERARAEEARARVEKGLREAKDKK
jgi:hypothetical protein